MSRPLEVTSSPSACVDFYTIFGKNIRGIVRGNIPLMRRSTNVGRGGSAPGPGLKKLVEIAPPEQTLKARGVIQNVFRPEGGSFVVIVEALLLLTHILKKVPITTMANETRHQKWSLEDTITGTHGTRVGVPNTSLCPHGISVRTTPPTPLYQDGMLEVFAF